jgi:hypothetical protein
MSSFSITSDSNSLPFSKYWEFCLRSVAMRSFNLFSIQFTRIPLEKLSSQFYPPIYVFSNVSGWFQRIRQNSFSFVAYPKGANCYAIWTTFAKPDYITIKENKFMIDHHRGNGKIAAWRLSMGLYYSRFIRKVIVDTSKLLQMIEMT